jgi:hypothetical protein
MERKMNEQDQDQAEYEEAPYVGQIVQPKTLTNATTREPLKLDHMIPARLDAEAHKQYKSRGL